MMSKHATMRDGHKGRVLVEKHRIQLLKEATPVHLLPTTRDPSMIAGRRQS